MLGKAEYVKFVLGSVCHERAKIFIVDKVLGDFPNILNNIAKAPGPQSNYEARAVSYLKDTNWYAEFVKEIDVNFRKLYRLGAFLSKTIKDDKFIARKIDSELKSIAEAKKGASYSIGGVSLGYSTSEIGDYYLQQIFVEAMAELIERGL